MDDWQKKYRWVRTKFDDERPEERSLQDYSGYDGGEYVGRIFLETAGPTKGKWRWAGGRPKALKGASIMPNAGYCKTAAEAAQTVEGYWIAMKARMLNKD